MEAYGRYGEGVNRVFVWPDFCNRMKCRVAMYVFFIKKKLDVQPLAGAVVRFFFEPIEKCTTVCRGDGTPYLCLIAWCAIVPLWGSAVVKFDGY